MELFLLLIPALILPIGLSVAGIWWLFNSDDADAEELLDDEWADGAM